MFTWFLEPNLPRTRGMTTPAISPAASLRTRGRVGEWLVGGDASVRGVGGGAALTSPADKIAHRRQVALGRIFESVAHIFRQILRGVEGDWPGMLVKRVSVAPSYSAIFLTFTNSYSASSMISVSFETAVFHVCCARCCCCCWYCAPCCCCCRCRCSCCRCCSSAGLASYAALSPCLSASRTPLSPLGTSLRVSVARVEIRVMLFAACKL